MFAIFKGTIGVAPSETFLKVSSNSTSFLDQLEGRS